MQATIERITDPKGFIFDPSLVLYLPLWKLDRASFMSRDAYGHLCTVTGAVWRLSGRYFDGTDDKIECGNQGITGNFTVEAWIKMTSATVDAWQAFYSAVGTEIWLGTNPNSDTVRLHIGGANDWTDCTFDLGTAWHHVVGTWNGTTGLITIDNVDQDMTPSGTPNNPTAGDAAIGVESVSDGNDLDGYVGEVRVYNRALASLEIQHNYLATKWRYR